MTTHVFDLDGTLLDSMAMWDQLAEMYLKSHGIQPEAQLISRLLTLTLKQSAALFHEKLLPHLSPEAIETEMEALIRIHYEEKLKLKPGAKAYVKAVVDQGHEAILATASPRYLAESVVRRFQLPFHRILTADEVGYAKDDPRFFAIFDKPFIVYEDILYAMEAARANGAYVVAIAEPSAAYPEEIKAFAHEYWEDWHHDVSRGKEVFL